MKKVLSLTLALLMFAASFSAFTASAATPTKVNQQLEKAATYVANNTNMSTVSYADFWLLTDSGYDMSAYKGDYLVRLKDDLDSNSGKIIVSGTEWYQDEKGEWQSYSYSYEDIAVYAAVIATLDAMGENPADFEGYNIVETFKAFDLSALTNPYSYRLAVFVAHEILGDDTLTDAIVKDMITRFYTLGKGMSYYDTTVAEPYYSCDNTGYFLAAMWPVSTHKEYFKYIDDACGVIKTYTNEDGAFSDPIMNPNANADSTALAMLAYASIFDIDNANWYYDKLISNFYNSESGAFTVPNYETGDPEDNLYATKEGLMALIRFSRIANFMHCYNDVSILRPAGFNGSGVKTRMCELCNDVVHETIPAIDSVTLSAKSYTYNGKAKTPAVTVKDVKGNIINSDYYTVKYKNNTKAGTATATVTFSGLYFGTLNLNFRITKAANTLVAKGKTATVKLASLKKKKQTVAQKKAFAISKAQGAVTYKKASGNAKITVAKGGKITVKKGLKKGTYKVKVKVTAAGNANYKAATKNVTVTIKVK